MERVAYIVGIRRSERKNPERTERVTSSKSWEYWVADERGGAGKVGDQLTSEVAWPLNASWEVWSRVSEERESS
eukprot:3024831-Pyramimonas_sp.AAC.1